MSFRNRRQSKPCQPLRILLLVSALSFCSYSLSQSANNFSTASHAHLTETGDQLHRQGQFVEAEAVFKQLFTSVRANHGLYHAQQFAALDRLIQINLANADWPELKQYLDYHDWLLNRLYANNALELAQHLRSNALHHEQAATRTTGAARNWHLVQTRQQLWRAVSALEPLPSENSRLPALLYRIALHHYALSRQSDLSWLTSFENRSDEPVRISGWALQGSDIWKRSYEIGAELIARITRQYADDPTAEPGTHAALMAQLLAYQGDWELLFGRERDAYQFYEQSLELAEQSSCGDLVRKHVFKTMTELPVTHFAINHHICLSQSGLPLTADDAVPFITASGIYRPQRQQNQWQSGPELAAVNTGGNYEQ